MAKTKKPSRLSSPSRRRLVLAACVLAAGYPVVALSLGFAENRTVLGIDAFEGFALAQQARNRVTARQSGGSLALGLPAEARSAALAAYRAEPYATNAHFVLAVDVLSGGNTDRADEILSASARFDRGNQPTGLLRLQRAAERGDYPGTIEELHYLAALNPDLISQLVPALMPALEDPRSFALLEQALRDHPRWGAAFWAAVPDHPEQFDRFYALRLRMPAQLDQQSDTRIVERLAARKEYDRAFEFLQFLGVGSALEPPAYLATTDYAPIGWQLAARGPVRVRMDGEELGVRVEAGSEGEAARQILRLADGPQQLRYRIAGDQDAVSVRVECAGREGTIAAGTSQAIVLPPAEAGCEYAWLVVDATAWQSPIQKRARFRARSED